ncbi:ABC-type transport system involved in cytochrome c biogenesis, permease component [Rubidibacter lacunae KORDI 51-2]|uniref:ABC-type transport system involved in cytochrome c biogenesis, permease component n=1 Tax=Rubidibacter lacunae KORDI 51-2 TaxID=582515 RepID=U5DGA4_9CHRO|nr:cytochrome c biogenesis protein CcsA [Rubidibacter lacunae]ERN40601.1 ABC-type transport system involved in cytochrome c biogenesis, permease component [Rubidibacter lacunae KORDI 51-2]
MKVLAGIIGFCLGCLLLLLPLGQFQPDNLDSLRTLAVQLDGRKKPLDTVAKETVAQIYGATTYRHDERAEDYFDTYLSLWFNTRNWNTEPFILVGYRPLREVVGLDRDRKRFAFQELVNNSELGALVGRARQKRADDQDLERLEREALAVEDRVTLLYNAVGDTNLPLVPHPSDLKGTWVGLSQGQKLYEPETIAPLLADYALMQQTLLSGGALHLNAIAPLAAALKDGLTALSPAIYPADAVLAREVRFNHFHPFAKAWKLYGLAFAIALASIGVLRQPLYWGAIGLFITGIGIQTYGFWARMQIAGRPPVTNMYESVVWVGFGIAAIALVFELCSRARYYLLAAAPLAIVCLVLADSLPAVLDPTISPLVPVLRDNFWLSIHVPTIALSYASFALALGVGHVAIANYVFAPQATLRLKTLTQLNYRVLQVGVLLLTAGIILGGIWAHFSWGRFWGWDPKETWALIALLCYVAPLHGRLVGWIDDFGLNVTSIVSFNAVLMAWYGVNFVLGSGLHSYGFGTGGSELAIASVVGVDLLLVAIAAARHAGWGSSAETLAAEGNNRKPSVEISGLVD